MDKTGIKLFDVTRNDVKRIINWLSDDDISETWFGRYSYGVPAHLGYHPEEVIEFSDDLFKSTFQDPDHMIKSIYLEDNEHIGEIHVAIEESLGDGQISILIGRKDLWHMGHGSTALRAALDICFENKKLHRVWADIPEYNTSAIATFQHLGFVHEGTLRKSRPHEGARFDSVIMGILDSEYSSIK